MLSPLNTNTCDHFPVTYITKWKTGSIFFRPSFQWTFSISKCSQEKIGLFRRLMPSSIQCSKYLFVWLKEKNKVTKSCWIALKMFVCNNYNCKELLFSVGNYFEFPLRLSEGNQEFITFQKRDLVLLSLHVLCSHRMNISWGHSL